MIFDFIYITACNFYRKREKDIFKISGLILFGAAILMNFMLAVLVYDRYGNHNFVPNFLDQSKWIMIGIYLFVFLPLLGLRYFKFTDYNEINNKIYKLSQVRRITYQIISICYLILSFVTTIGYCTYIGGGINGWW